MFFEKLLNNSASNPIILTINVLSAWINWTAYFSPHDKRDFANSDIHLYMGCVSTICATTGLLSLLLRPQTIEWLKDLGCRAGYMMRGMKSRTKQFQDIICPFQMELGVLSVMLLLVAFAIPSVTVAIVTMVIASSVLAQFIYKFWVSMIILVSFTPLYFSQVGSERESVSFFTLIVIGMWLSSSILSSLWLLIKRFYCLVRNL